MEKEELKKYKREYYLRNREKLLNGMKILYESHKDDRNKYYEKYKEEIKEYMKKYRQDNKERLREYNREYQRLYRLLKNDSGQ